MKNIFKHLDSKEFTKTVNPTDVAQFETGTVHEVYSTFALTRDAEWSGRLFVLDMLEDGEQGIGTYIEVAHKSPALVGELINFKSTFIEINAKQEIITEFIASVNDRVIASGSQAQRILPITVIENIFKQLGKT